MLYIYFRTPYQTILIDPFLKLSFLKKTSPNFLTILGLFLGVLSSFFIFKGFRLVPAIFLILSGYLDTLDGSIARANNKQSDFGSVLDIFSDRLVEFSIILAFFLFDPSRGVYTMLMLGSSYLCVTSFLVVGIFSKNTQEKSFYYSPGIIERGEAFVFFILMILFQKHFEILALLYTFLVLLTAFIRVFEFRKKSFIKNSF